MYRRYSQANGNAASPGQVKRSRIKDLLILLLAGLLTAALIIAGMRRSSPPDGIPEPQCRRRFSIHPGAGPQQSACDPYHQ